MICVKQIIVIFPIAPKIYLRNDELFRWLLIVLLLVSLRSDKKGLNCTT